MLREFTFCQMLLTYTIYIHIIIIEYIYIQSSTTFLTRICIYLRTWNQLTVYEQERKVTRF